MKAEILCKFILVRVKNGYYKKEVNNMDGGI